MMRRSAPFVLLLALGCSASWGGDENTPQGVLLVYKTQSFPEDLEGLYVEAYSDPNFNTLVRRSLVEEVRGDTALLRTFWLPQGDYYIRAWKDVDGDGTLSDRDIIGCYGYDYSCSSPEVYNHYVDGYVGVNIGVYIHSGGGRK